MSEKTASTKAARSATSGAFETGLQRLEKIVTDLERPDLSLEDSIKLFEEGMALADECRKQLDAAEGKVEILVKRAGAVTAQPYRLPDDEAER